MNASHALGLAVPMLVLVAALAHAAESPTPYGLPYLARFHELPLLKDFRCLQASSYDRSGGNADSGRFIRREGRVGILADLKGPGCVYRLWSANPRGQLRMYFDGESEPRIDCPFQDLFTDGYPPFATPLAGRSSGGWYSFLPIPYAKSLRIEVEDPGALFYQVQYHQLPAGTPVRSFTRELSEADRAALAVVLDQWRNRGRLPDAPAGLIAADGRATLAPGASATLLDRREPGTLRALVVNLAPTDRFTRRNLLIRAFWDGADKPAIEAPLGDFFGDGFEKRSYAAMPMAVDDGRYSCFFPMPFGTSARIEIINQGDTPASIRWETQVDPAAPDMKASAYFHAGWQHTITQTGRPVTLLETNGRGHFVGVSLNMQGGTHPRHDLWFLEGDEQIYVDGETTPSTHGTGLEDYFSAGWYFNTGPFALPYHGLTVKDYPHSRISCYRFQIPECIPFRRSIRVDIEHGGSNDYPGADYWWTSYWYQDSPASGWPRIAPAAGRRPVSLRVKNAIEAESLSPDGGELMDDRHLTLELSGGAAIHIGPAARAALRLSVPDDGDYFLAVGTLGGPRHGAAEVRIDGRPAGTINTAAGQLIAQRHVVGPLRQLSRGAAALSVHAVDSDNEGVVLDWVALHRQVPGRPFEGEWLPVVDRSPDAQTSMQKLSDLGNAFSNQHQLLVESRRPGQFVTLRFPVEKAGRYRLFVIMGRGGDYGQVKLSLNGEEIPGVYDGYARSLSSGGRQTLGTFDLAAGGHELRFEVVGRNESSRGHLMGIDAIVLE